MSLKSEDWANLLVNALVQLLLAYVARQGKDAGQEVLSRVSHSIENTDPEVGKLVDPRKVRWPLLPTQVERDAAALCVGAACPPAKPSHLNGVKVRPDLV